MSRVGGTTAKRGPTARSEAPTGAPVVGVYVRISKDQEGQRLGVERQREDCLALCEANGWQVHRIYEDNDISASRYSKKKRPEYEALISDLKDGTIQGVVYYSQTRLTRRTPEFAEFCEIFREAKGEVLAEVDGGIIDLDTTGGRMTTGMKAIFAAEESEATSVRTKRAKRAKAEKGLPERTSGRIPFGFQDDFITHNPSDVLIIKEATERILAGEGLRAIAFDMADRGVVNAEGKSIAYPAWKHILESPRIAGFRDHEGVLFQAQWEPILDPETWEAVVAVLNTKTGSRPKANVKHLLSGILICEICKCKMVNNKARSTVKNGEKSFYNTYACRKAPGTKKCGKMSIRKEQVDERVKALVFERILSTNLPEKEKPESGNPLTLELLAAQERLSKLEHDFYFAGTMKDEKKFYSLSEQLNELIEDLEMQINNRSADTNLRGIPRTPEALQEAWDSKGIEWQRAVVHSICESVTIRKALTKGPNQDYSARISVKIREGN